MTIHFTLQFILILCCELCVSWLFNKCQKHLKVITDPYSQNTDVLSKLLCLRVVFTSRGRVEIENMMRNVLSSESNQTTSPFLPLLNPSKMLLMSAQASLRLEHLFLSHLYLPVNFPLRRASKTHMENCQVSCHMI